MSRRTRIKICCIADAAEAKLAVEAGADVLGLVGDTSDATEAVDEAALGALASAVPPGVATFLRTGLYRPEMLAAQHTRCRTTALEIVNELPTETYPTLRQSMPGVGLVQAVRLSGGEAVAEALGAARLVDALLADVAGVDEWDVARTVVVRVDRPVYLAGGLTPQNVGEAIDRVRPFGVCVARGVRTDGRLDPEKLAAFVAAVNAADAQRRAGAGA